MNFFFLSLLLSFVEGYCIIRNRPEHVETGGKISTFSGSMRPVYLKTRRRTVNARDIYFLRGVGIKLIFKVLIQ